MPMFTIVLASVAIGVLLLSLNLRSRWPAWVKLSATLVVAVLYIGVYLAVSELRGYPASAAVPADFELLATHTEEPSGNSDGAIFLWLRDRQQPDAEPRAYRLAYRREAHTAVATAGAQLRQGQRVHGRRSTPGSRAGDGNALGFEFFVPQRHGPADKPPLR